MPTKAEIKPKMNHLLQKIQSACREEYKKGAVATYIPELGNADPRDFGIAIATNEGEIFYTGAADKHFTMQSIIKPIILLLAIQDAGHERVRALVGVESTGKPFDSFNYSDLALTGEHINPMINTGAIALCSLIKGTNEEKFERLISLVKRLSKGGEIHLDEAVYRSESRTGNKNRALAYLLKAYKLIDCDAEEIVDFYFRACSITASCRDLARIALVFANHGRDPISGEAHFDAHTARYINAILTICGMYDGSGDFALNVGVPAKSGVGGGIMAIVPGKMGIGVFSPALDSKGNSVAGLAAMKMLSEELDMSIF